MANQPINYTTLLNNVEQMINLLEYDAMRSAGKAKVNVHPIHGLYELADRYREMLTKPVEPVVVKKQVKKDVEE
jgi:hypothetical protein